MIGVIAGAADEAAREVVVAALGRSISRSLIGTGAAHPIVLSIGTELERLIGARKRLHFGRLPADLRGRLSAVALNAPLNVSDALANDALSHAAAESRLAVQYRERARCLGAGKWRRPFVRYDYANEWNNLGFGAIRADGSIWAVAETLSVADDLEIATVVDHAEGRLCSYAALVEDEEGAVLWFNRPVGPIDSFEWRLVENFASSYGAGGLPILPVTRELPFGHDAAVIARLDCDEDIESARPLWQAYDELGVPLSLAVHTRLLDGGSPPPLLIEAAGRNGTVLSHSATHVANWGGTYELAFAEAFASARAIEDATGVRPRYAVSPFHLTPDFALRALGDAGYAGCVGGAISGPPEFVMARGGRPAYAREGFIGQTAQCMLHGDCMLNGEDPLRVYRHAFDLALETAGLFAYLDHPFSRRYSYGWRDEDARVEAHRELVAYIRLRAKTPLFMTAGAALDFLAARDGLRVVTQGGGYRIQPPPAEFGEHRVAVEFAGNIYAVVDELELA